MLRNYLSAALGNLANNKLHATINVLGLAVGLTAAILIALFVRDEFTYESWVPNHERIFRVDEIYAVADQPRRQFAVTGVRLAQDFRIDFPEVEAATRYAYARYGIRHGDIETIQQVVWADASFFDFFPLAVIAGDAAAALTRPDGIAITRSMARKYFGTDVPLGQSLEIDHEHLMQVVAVLEDLPANTQLNAQIFLSSHANFSTIAEAEALPWEKENGHQFVYTFLRLTPGASASTIEARLPAFVDRHLPPDPGMPQLAKLSLVPLLQTHLTVADFPGKPIGNAAADYAMSVIAVLILGAAGINFVNLMTARAARRATEVGVRKATGAVRRDLVFQFLGETALYVLLASIIAVVAVTRLLPVFNGYLEREITVDLWHNVVMLSAIAAVPALLTLLAGAYPAFVLSAFRPASVLRSGGAPSPGWGHVRNALVVIQFAILSGLCVATVTVYRQGGYAMREGLRPKADTIVLVDGAETCASSFVEAVKAIPGVRNWACSGIAPTMEGSNRQLVAVPGRQPIALRNDYIGPGFFELYGVSPLAGRLFEDRPGDESHENHISETNPPVVINETARRELGFNSPQDAIGRSILWKRVFDFKTRTMSERLPSEIIGVVPDFILDSVREKIDPAFFYFDRNLLFHLSLKLDGRLIPETLVAIDKLWKTTDARRPIERRFLDQYMETLYRDITRQSQLFGIFAGVAIFIAALGLLGLSSFVVEQRIKEIGVRKAMGASQADVVRMLLWQFVKPVVWANALAWPIAGYAMQRWLGGFAYHIDLSLWMFVASGAMAVIIAVVTVMGHALIVARAQPVYALRYE